MVSSVLTSTAHVMEGLQEDFAGYETLDQYTAGVEALKTKAKARSKLKPIADPDADKAKRRKKSAKRRQQSGRVSTILSNSETLG